MLCFPRPVLLFVFLLLLAPIACLADDDLVIHGMISQGYLKSSDNNFLTYSEDGSLEFSEFVLNFQKRMDDRLRIGMQLLSRDLGKAGNNQTKVDWAYGDYSLNDNWGLRLGSVKIPFGLYNKFRDIDMLRNTVLLPATVYMEDYRQYITSMKGGSIYATLPAGKGDFELELAYGCSELPDPGLIKDMFIDFNGPLEQGFSAMLPAGLQFKHAGDPTADGRTKNGYAAKLLWNTPVEGLRIGGTRLSLNLSFYETLVFQPVFMPAAPAGLTTVAPGFQSDVTIRFRPLVDVGSFEYVHNKFTFAGEYMAAHTKQNFAVTTSPAMGPTMTGSLAQTRQGAYLQAIYQHNNRHIWGIYRGEYFADRSNKIWTNWQKDTCLSFRYNVTESWCLKIENHWMDGVGLCQKNLNPNTMDRRWNMLAMKTTYNF
ncbi:MAG: hypothetical protein AB1403_02915 [Candidatus Riflebacteria bacterium]